MSKREFDLLLAALIPADWQESSPTTDRVAALVCKLRRQTNTRSHGQHMARTRRLMRAEEATNRPVAGL